MIFIGKNKSLGYDPIPFAIRRELLEAKSRLGRVPDYMKLKMHKDSGVFLGRIGHDNDRYVGKPQGKEGHVVVFGGSGIGKSTCIAIPNLETWQGPIIALDIKGELTRSWNRKKFPKRHTKVFDLSRTNGTLVTYDPYYFICQDSPDNLVQNVRELAQAIIPLPYGVRETFWIEAAQSVLAAAILYHLSLGLDFNGTMTAITYKHISKLVGDIINSDNQSAKALIALYLDADNLSDSKILTGIGAEINNKIVAYATDIKIKTAFTPNNGSLTWEEIDRNNIFISVPEDRIDQLGGVVTLMLTQLVRSLERRPDKYSPQGRNLQPVLLLLDEFPRFGKMDVIANALATLRSKGVTICIFMQSLAQLDAIYGVNMRRIILDNCIYKAILGVTDADSQQYFSRLIGTTTKFTKSFSENFDSERNTIGYSQQFSEHREPIFHPHEFAYLDDIVLQTPQGHCRILKTPYFTNKYND